MKIIRYSCIAALLSALSCSTAKKNEKVTVKELDLQAHRGGRGLMPENTIPAMKEAIELGVTTLEMDVVISKDNKVVVSHDTYFNDNFSTSPEGKFLTKKEATQHLLYQMTYDSIKKYDVGLKPHPGFPNQKKMHVFKPLLSDLIDSSEAYAQSKGKKMKYNIEIKSKSSYDGIQHPAPEQFTDLLLQVLQQKGILERTIVQSFDVRPLQYIHKNYPDVVVSYLVEQTSGSLEEQLRILGFVPNIYSPNYAGVTKELVKQCHEQGIKVIPWTVNTVVEMNNLVSMDVDGIISDYPNLFSEIQQQK